jgi:predicted nucleotidyltransferase
MRITINANHTTSTHHFAHNITVDIEAIGSRVHLKCHTVCHSRSNHLLHVDGCTEAPTKDAPTGMPDDVDSRMCNRT